MNQRSFSFLLLLMLIVGCTCCTNADKGKKYVPQIVDDKSAADSAIIEFEEVVIDFGIVDRTENPDFFVEFNFANVGQSPLVIYKADVTCSCISAEFPKQAFVTGQDRKERLL